MYYDPGGYVGEKCTEAKTNDGQGDFSDSQASNNGSVTQVEYGSTDLSQEAINYRKDNDIKGGRNVSVFEYEDNGQINTIACASERNKGHAERLLAKTLESMGIPADKVTRIYSELQPCSLPFAHCMNFLQRVYPQADITYSFEYGATKESRTAGLNALLEAVKSIFGGK